MWQDIQIYLFLLIWYSSMVCSMRQKCNFLNDLDAFKTDLVITNLGFLILYKLSPSWNKGEVNCAKRRREWKWEKLINLMWFCVFLLMAGISFFLIWYNYIFIWPKNANIFIFFGKNVRCFLDFLINFFYYLIKFYIIY